MMLIPRRVSAACPSLEARTVVRVLHLLSNPGDNAEWSLAELLFELEFEGVPRTEAYAAIDAASAVIDVRCAL